MKLGGKHFPNLIRKPSGFYWNAPPAARPLFGSISLGKELDLEAYYRAEASLARWRRERKAKKVEETGPRYGTVDWLLCDYMNHRWFTKRPKKTRTDYRNKLLAMANFRLLDGTRFGDLPWTDINAKHTDKLHEMMCFAGDGGLREAYARAVMHTARIVWNWAKRYHNKSFHFNPFDGMRLETPDPRPVKWEHDQVVRFLAKAEQMGRLSVGMVAVFCYELGQRVGDARKMTRSMFEGDGIICFEQGKTGKQMTLPVSPVLKAWVDKMPQGRDELVVNETTGRVYEDYELSKAAAEVREAAQLPSYLWIADLRRTCINQLGRLGASDDELISVSGHTKRQTLSVYSLAEYQKALRVMQLRWENRDAA